MGDVADDARLVRDRAQRGDQGSHVACRLILAHVASGEKSRTSPASRGSEKRLMLEQHKDRPSSDDRSFSEVILRSVDEDLTRSSGAKSGYTSRSGLARYRGSEPALVTSLAGGAPVSAACGAPGVDRAPKLVRHSMWSAPQSCRLLPSIPRVATRHSWCARRTRSWRAPTNHDDQTRGAHGPTVANGTGDAGAIDGCLGPRLRPRLHAAPLPDSALACSSPPPNQLRGDRSPPLLRR